MAGETNGPLFQFKRPALILGCLMIITVLAVITAALVQNDFGRLTVKNVSFENEAGRNVRAKLLFPKAAESAVSDFPGIVYLHGYQNNRETSDPYSIELARRGFVVLAIDTLGRGNSDNPGDLTDEDFDESYGGRAAMEYLRGLPYVDTERVGIMGHSLGAEMAYGVALKDPGIRALAFSGFGYTLEADLENPKNMLMIFGKYDEYRKRMTGTRDFEAEFMVSPQTGKVFPSENPEIGVTYGDFSQGTARRVYMPKVTHVEESHHRGSVAEAVDWMVAALKPDTAYLTNARSQIWQIKEGATLIALLACFAALFPLADLLLKNRAFSILAGAPAGGRVCGRREAKGFFAVNTLFTWCYLPLVLILFAVHLYVVRIDRVFPLMMANGIIFWFLVTNIIGLVLFRRWRRREGERTGLSLADSGLSHAPDRFYLGGGKAVLTILFSLSLFLFALLFQLVLERIFIIDFRFIYPFASDLPLFRVPLVLLYTPFLFIGFLGQGTMIHVQLRPPADTGWKTFFRHWLVSAAAVILPILTIILVQYLPYYTLGFLPFVGPGAALVGFVINLFPIIVKLVIATALSSFLFLRTGSLYPGALTNALIVAWMFASSQVIAPIPV